MGRIYTAISIARPPAAVFDYVTTAGHWKDWHPSTLGVSGATDHPARLGEEMTEEAVVAGRQGAVTWRVIACEPPRRWAITGQFAGASGGSGTITYTLTPRDGGTHFEREFVYKMANPLLTLAVLLAGRRRVASESRQALRNLKARLEAGA